MAIFGMQAICVKHTENFLGHSRVKSFLVSDCFHVAPAELKVDRRHMALQSLKYLLSSPFKEMVVCHVLLEVHG